MSATVIEPIEIVLPVHNEAASIEQTLREFYRVATDAGYTIRFRACEDGSTDGTQTVLTGLAEELPLHVDTSPERRGYSRAAIDGLRGAAAPIIGFIDSDGQCDPHDLPLLVNALQDNDIVFGYRSPRVDPLLRRLMSAAFGVVFQVMFHVPRRDPSCPYLLGRRDAIQLALCGAPGILPQGFWWEFSARANAAGLRIAEVPVHHRRRAAGTTQVYRPMKVPGIAAKHLFGLTALREDLARIGT